jgi:chromosomal replication initiation ATPase DnaA
MFEEIIDEKRSLSVVLVRQEICWHMARNLKMSFNRIGELLKRDNTTIMHSVRRHQKVLDDASKQA